MKSQGKAAGHLAGSFNMGGVSIDDN